MLLRPDSYKRGVIKSSLFNVMAKGLGFVNSLLIIYIFGSGLKTDLYFVIVSTGLVITSFINSIDSLVLLPESMRLREKEGEDAERRFLNFYIRLYFVIGLALFAVVVFLPTHYYSIFSKLDGPFLSTERLTLQLSAVLAPLQLVINLFVSILASKKYFTTPMIVALVNSTISIVVLLLIGDVFSLKGALAALVAGNFVNLLWIIRHFRNKLDWHFGGKAKLPSRRMLGNISLMQLNVLPVTIRNFATVYFVSGLGAGIITSLTYGQQIALIPELLLISQVMVVAGIKFNELSARNDQQGFNSFLQQFLRIVLFVALPLGIFMAVTSEEIVKILFGFSTRFTGQSASAMALVISFIALTLPARALDLCLTRIVMSQQKIRHGVLYGVLTQVSITILVIAGVTLYGLKGYLSATLIGYTVILPVVYYFLLRRVAPFLEFATWLRRSIPFIVCNVVIMAGLYFLRKEFLPGWPPVLVLLILGILYALIILVVNNRILHYAPSTASLRNLILKK